MSPRALSFFPALLAAGLVGCGPTTSPSKQITGKPESSASSGSGSVGTSSSASSVSSSAAGSSGHSSAASSSSAAASSAGSTGGHSSSAASSSTGTTGDDPTPDLGPATPICTVLESTTDVNLRSGPATTFSVILVVPTGAQVTTINSEQSQNGFYNVSYQGIQGYTYADYYRVVSVGTGAGCGSTTTTSTSSSSSSSSGGGSTGGHSSSTGGSTGSTGTQTARDVGIQKAQEAMGFSYYWGHGRFLTTGPTSSTIGSCTGNCPSCTHTGSYGGDCSGLAGKVWLLGNPDMTVDSHPYSTYDFVNSTHGWHSTTRDALIRGDALTYNTNGAGHIFIYESGDGWGDMWAYECKGCAAGCVHDLRSAGSAYIAIARDGW